MSAQTCGAQITSIFGSREVCIKEQGHDGFHDAGGYHWPRSYDERVANEGRKR